MSAILFEDREAYRIAEEKATRDLGSLDPLAVAAERLVVFDRDMSLFRVKLIDREIVIRYPGGQTSLADGSKVSGSVALVALHYLVYRGRPAGGEGWLPYREMVGAREFSRAFEHMAEKRLAEHFGEKLGAFVDAATALGGESYDRADSSFVIKVLPRISLLVSLWLSTDEFPASAMIFYEPKANYYLHTEDLAVIGILTVDRLISVDREKTSGSDSGQAS